MTQNSSRAVRETHNFTKSAGASWDSSLLTSTSVKKTGKNRVALVALPVAFGHQNKKRVPISS